MTVLPNPVAMAALPNPVAMAVLANFVLGNSVAMAMVLLWQCYQISCLAYIPERDFWALASRRVLY